MFGWRHAPGADPDPALCLPFQLQALFARLACSRCAAVSTKPLTASFGWTAADSFHQHDVQELNRVLFDALARSSTSFADVSRHYTGRMNDYIQDLRWPAAGCVRRAHEEEFMDVQLDVGGGIGTIEEALGRFIEPEIMDGDNKVCPLTAQPIAGGGWGSLVLTVVLACAVAMQRRGRKGGRKEGPGVHQLPGDPHATPQALRVRLRDNAATQGQ